MPHIISLSGEAVNRPLPADAVTIPAPARGIARILNAEKKRKRGNNLYLPKSFRFWAKTSRYRTLPLL